MVVTARSTPPDGDPTMTRLRLSLLACGLAALATGPAARGKPLLLWEMDGHPLGCT